jgi:hypothetical protein
MAEPKQVKVIKGGLNIAKRLLADGEEAGLTAAQRAEAGKKAAELIKTQPQVKASEALGQLMEKGVKRTTTTQSDRTRVGGGNIGGAPFSAISEADPAYKGKVWGVMDEGTAARLKNLTDDETAWTTMLGSASQLKTNPIVFDKLKRGFITSMKQGNLSDELAGKINHNLALTFGEGADIRDPKIWRQADTFEKRSALADVMMGQGTAPSKGGVAIGGEKSGKGVIFRPTDILKRETEPYLLHTEHGGDVPTFAAGPRLFKLEKESVYDPSLHPGFPTLLKGKDYGINMKPTPTEVFLPDWHKRFKANNPDRKGPGYYDLALGVKGEGLPSQDLHDEYIRHLLREGFKKGGEVDMDAADARLTKAIEARMSGGGMAKGGSVDIKSADARLQAAIDARIGMAEGGEAGFKKIQFMENGGKAGKVGKLASGIANVGKRLLADAPQAEALKLAQERAALPVSKGGLGLPKNNTPEQRAKAMGFDRDTYHGSFRDIKRLDPSVGSTESHAGKGIYSTDSPEDASRNYASIYGPDPSGRVARGMDELEKDWRKTHGRMRDENLTPRQQDILLRNTIGTDNLGVVYPLKVRSDKSIHLDKPEKNEAMLGPFQHYDEATDTWTDTKQTPKFNEALDDFRGKGGDANPIYEFVQDYGGNDEFPARQLFKVIKKEGDESGLYDPFTGDIVSGGVAAGDFMKHFGVDEIRHTPQFNSLELNIGKEHTISMNPDNVRSRFAAFDPFRKSSAIAASMGVAAPDLMAKEKDKDKKKAEGGPAFKKLEFMADGGKLVKGAAQIGKRLMADNSLPALEREANLQKFLAKSQVKDPVFHASKADVKKFSPKHRTGVSSMGHHFGTAEQANFRTTQYDFDSQSPNIGKYHLSIENPLEVSHMASFAPDHLAEQLMDMNLLKPETYDALSAKHNYDNIAIGDELVKVLRKSGYDGLKYANEREGQGFSYVPLNPTQIKSATGNRGTYDLEDADISKADGGKIVKGLGKVGRKLLADPEKKIIEPPSIIIPSKVSNVKDAMRKRQGEFGARRVERAADEVPNLEKMYQEEALKQAFGGDNAKGMMTINPKDFEKYAMPLPMNLANDKAYFKQGARNPTMREAFINSGLSNEQWHELNDIQKMDVFNAYSNKVSKMAVNEPMEFDQYLKHLADLDDGFEDVPFLQINKQEQGLPLMPFISGHEGRHRNRALAGRGEEKSLVQLLPRAELREPFPRRSQEEYLEALKKEMEMTGNMVRPEAEDVYGAGQIQQIKRKPIQLPDVYAEGGGAFKTLQFKDAQHFDGGGIAIPEMNNSFEGSRREPLLTEKDWANIKRNAPEVYDWAKQNVKDEASQLKTARGVKDFALRTGAQYLGGIPDLVNLGLMGVDALADTSLSSEKPWFGSEQYIDALKRSGAVGENEFPIAETVAGIAAPAGLIKKGVKQLRKMRPKAEPKKRRGGLTAMSR